MWAYFRIMTDIEVDRAQIPYLGDAPFVAYSHPVAPSAFFQMMENVQAPRVR